MNQTNIHALAPGYRIHWYEIESVLGQGGFGITYLARDTNLDTKVAIKEYLPTDLAGRTHDGSVNPISQDRFSDFGWGLERFISEAKTLAKFNHPNIVKAQSVFELNNTAYMVMEYEEGRSLQEAFQFRQVESEEALKKILFGLLDGVATIHQAGFIHRDIKPANIYLRPDGTPVLLDFGSARQALGVRTKTLTALVTPGYAPFEQYDTTQGSDKQGPWTDIYALGATLYRAVTGEGPPDAMMRANALFEGKDALVPAMALGRGRYSTSFLHAIDQALAFRSQDRPQSIAEWRSMFVGAPQAANADDLPSAAETVAFVEDDETSLAQQRDDEVAPPQLAATSTSSSSSNPKKWTTPLLVTVICILGGMLAWTFFDKHSESEIASSRETTSAGISSTQPAESNVQSEEAASRAAIERLAEAEKKAKQEQQRIAALKAEEEVRLAALKAAEDARIKAEEEAKRLADERLQQEQERLAQLEAEETQRLAEIKRLEEATKKAGEEKARLAALRAAEEAKIAELARLEAERQEAEAARLEEANRLKVQQEKLAKLQAEEQAARLAAEKAAVATQLAEQKRLEDEHKAREETARLAAVKAEEAAKIAERERLEDERQNAAKAQSQGQDDIASLLADGHEHLKNLRLTNPAGNNARDSFRAVLALDPGNAEAQTGLKSIVTKYLGLTAKAIANADYEKAERYLDRADLVLPGQEEVIAARVDLTQQRTAAIALNVQEESVSVAAVESASIAGERQTTAVESSEPVTNSTVSAASPRKVGILRVLSNTNDAYWDRDIGKILQKIVKDRHGYAVEASYYRDQVFADDQINTSGLWQGGGTRKAPNLQRIYARAAALKLDVIVGAYQRKGDWYNVDTSTVNIYVIDIDEKKVFEGETKYPGLTNTLESLLDSHAAEL